MDYYNDYWHIDERKQKRQKLVSELYSLLSAEKERVVLMSATH